LEEKKKLEELYKAEQVVVQEKQLENERVLLQLKQLEEEMQKRDHQIATLASKFQKEEGQVAQFKESQRTTDEQLNQLEAITILLKENKLRLEAKLAKMQELLETALTEKDRMMELEKMVRILVFHPDLVKTKAQLEIEQNLRSQAELKVIELEKSQQIEQSASQFSAPDFSFDMGFGAGESDSDGESNDVGGASFFEDSEKAQQETRRGRQRHNRRHILGGNELPTISITPAHSQVIFF
jgi:hypothetical protein